MVTVANHGGEAVKMLQEGPEPPPFDIVLMDLQMPEMDGYTATRLLRADPRFKDLPIIAMTAHALVEERQRCLEAGMNDHVTKPIDPDALFAALKRWAKPPRTRSSRGGCPAGASGRRGGTARDRGYRSGGRTEARRREQAPVPEPARAVRRKARGCRRADRRRAPERRPRAGKRIAHTVKGVAGNLGIRAVQIAAENVERAIRDEDASLPARLEAFASTLRVAIQAIEGTLAGKTEVAVPRQETFDPGLASAAAARLRALLEANDGEAADAFAAVENALAGVVDKRGSMLCGTPSATSTSTERFPVLPIS